jgi:hypothetical protein
MAGFQTSAMITTETGGTWDQQRIIVGMASPAEFTPAILKSEIIGRNYHK